MDHSENRKKGTVIIDGIDVDAKLRPQLYTGRFGVPATLKQLIQIERLMDEFPKWDFDTIEELWEGLITSHVAAQNLIHWINARIEAYDEKFA